MKAILISSGIDLTDISSGISKKIHKQADIFKNNGIDTLLISIPKEHGLMEYFKLLLPRKNRYYKYLKNVVFCNIDISQYTLFYIRKSTLSLSTVYLLSYIKSNVHKSIIMYEIPTYPFIGEYKGIKRGLIAYSLIVQNELKKYTDRIVTFSNDDKIWGVQTVQVSNCVDVNEIAPKKTSNNNRINMIAVASMDFWHGYDRLLKGMVDYYINGGQRDIHLFLVGESSLISKYRVIAKKGNIDNYVTFCGKKFGKDLDQIYDTCELGIDALARHRSRVTYNSSLKGKEYGAKGLPIVSGVTTELDTALNYSYYFRIPANDSNVDIEKLIEFYDSIYIKDKSEIISDIRTYTEKRFSYQAFYQAIKNAIDNIIDCSEG